MMLHVCVSTVNPKDYISCIIARREIKMLLNSDAMYKTSNLFTQNQMRSNQSQRNQYNAPTLLLAVIAQMFKEGIRYIA